ncbi:nitrogen fixation nifHD region glnB 1 [Clostridia bacterium]|nr:nitrogen fixation nifHD region glnB 1 [Clostridia bacterium]
MKLVKAIVRPEKASDILKALCDAGYISATRISILGRGKQKGLKANDVVYDEIPKEMILMVIPDEELESVEKIIIQTARTNKTGAFGDGKIFVIPVEREVTISSGEVSV